MEPREAPPNLEVRSTRVIALPCSGAPETVTRMGTTSPFPKISTLVPRSAIISRPAGCARRVGQCRPPALGSRAR
jgi:hypothetical protein